MSFRGDTKAFYLPSSSDASPCVGAKYELNETVSCILDMKL